MRAAEEFNLAGDLRSGGRRAEGGDVFVLRTGPKFELRATNAVGEQTNASLAAADGGLFLRTDKALWCLGAKK